MENIEKSEVVIARILSKVLEFGLQDAGLEFKELELGDSYAPFFSTCVDWLVAEGLIRVGTHIKTKDGECFLAGITLTSHGFAVLGQEISGTDRGETVADAVKQVTDSGAGYSGVGDFIGGLLGGFTKSISS